MSSLPEVLRSVVELTIADKFMLRDVLNTELAHESQNGPGGANALVGLLADEPQLADEILQSAMTARESRPFRVSS